jgi:hypothetical protein
MNIGNFPRQRSLFSIFGCKALAWRRLALEHDLSEDLSVLNSGQFEGEPLPMAPGRALIAAAMGRGLSRV